MIWGKAGPFVFRKVSVFRPFVVSQSVRFPALYRFAKRAVKTRGKGQKLFMRFLEICKIAKITERNMERNAFL